jgi:hypothetical protein
VYYRLHEIQTMIRLSIFFLVSVVCALMQEQATTAFSLSTPTPTRSASRTALRATSISRREAMLGFGAAAITGALIISIPQPASAKYSDYVRREKDWQERVDKGEVKISSARDLKTQLREIAPQNNEASLIFCPNGAPSSVSPLMENKCGDRLATPSVYGRQQDIVGNSIPGFKSGSGTDYSQPQTSSITASTGGFLPYKEGEFKLKAR